MKGTRTLAARHGRARRRGSSTWIAIGVLAPWLGACVAPASFEVDRPAVISAGDLHYSREVERSEAGLPIGNGRTGTLVWTEPDRIRLQVNRVDVFARNASVTRGEECDWAGGCAFVDIITGEETLPADDTEQRLSIYDALATVEGDGLSARLFTWSERDVIVVEIDDQRAEPAPIELELRMLRLPVVHQEDLVASSMVRYEDGVLGLEQTFDALQHHCRSAVAVDVVGAEASVRRVSNQAWRLTTSPAGGRVTFLIASAATLEADGDVALDARRQLEEAKQLGFEGMLQSHREHWRRFWERSVITAHSDDGEADLLQEYWTWTMYVMGSSSRGAFPPKFNGMIWSTDGDTRRWGSQYWWWNTQILYRGLLAANHPELMQPLYDLYGGMIEGARTAAREQWGSEGVFIGETSDYDGLEALPEDIARELRELLLGQKGYDETSPAFREFAQQRNGYNARWNWLHHMSTVPFSWVTHIVFSGAQVAWHHWRHYQYTLDEDFLRERAYPLIRGLAEFYRNFPNLVLEDDGRHHLHLLNDQELLWGTRDAHNELWAMRGMLTTAIEASKLLSVDAELRLEWRKLLESLTPAPRSTDADVIPGSYYPHPSGRPVWALGRHPCGKVEGLSSDTIVRPCVDYDLWSLESVDEELTRIAIDTYEADPMRLEALSDRRGYSLSELPLSAAALGRADDVRVILPDHLRRDLLPNRFSLEDGVQAQSIEPIATVATATQLALLQSRPASGRSYPVIRLFPAWPREWDASFELAARHGFIVRSTMKDGEITLVEIESQLGGRCRLRNPWGKGPVLLRRDGRSAESLRGSLLVFNTEPGETVGVSGLVGRAMVGGQIFYDEPSPQVPTHRPRQVELRR